MANGKRQQTPSHEHNPQIVAKAVDMLETAMIQAQKKAGRGSVAVRVARQNGRLGSIRLIIEDEPTI